MWTGMAKQRDHIKQLHKWNSEIIPLKVMILEQFVCFKILNSPASMSSNILTYNNQIW